MWVGYVSEFSLLECVSLVSSGVSVATCTAILHVGGAQQARTGCTSSKEEDHEGDAATIVQKCVSSASATGAPRIRLREHGGFRLVAR